MYKSILVCDLFDAYRSIPLPALHKLNKKKMKNSGFVLTRLYTDFTLHCRGLYIASLYCRCFGDAGGAGRKFQAPEKMCCIPNKERI